MFEWLTQFFNKERCNQCNVRLTNKDLKDGGAGYHNGKSFRYCISCSQYLISEAFKGKNIKNLVRG